MAVGALTNELRVFDADGVHLATWGRGGQALGFLETPAGLTILEIGADYLLGRATDNLEVESVQVWALER